MMVLSNKGIVKSGILPPRVLTCTHCKKEVKNDPKKTLIICPKCKKVILKPTY